MVELDDEIVEEIVRRPEKVFAHYVNVSEPLPVIELLNRVIVAENGFQRVIECLACWQDNIEANYCLEPVVNEFLRSDEPKLLHSCLAFFNALIQNAPNAVARIRIDHELKELNIGRRLDDLRTLKFKGLLGAFSGSIKKELDIWQMEHSRSNASYGSDVNGKAEDLSIVSDESDEECSMSSTTATSDSLSMAISNKEFEAIVNVLKPETKKSFQNESTYNSTAKSTPTPPIPPPLPKFFSPHVMNGNLPSSPRTPAPPPFPPAPPPLPPQKWQSVSHKCPEANLELPSALRLRTLPKEGTKLKQIQWTKIPFDKIFDGRSDKQTNVWETLVRIPESEFAMDFVELESMFSCGEQNTAEHGTLDRRQMRKNESISLLCHKRSFNVSIFLKQFKDGADQIIIDLEEGRGELIGYERLQALQAILPDNEELEILRGFSGDTSQLGSAEQFFLNLIAVPDYKLKLSCLILKEELLTVFDIILPQIQTVITASLEIKKSKYLPKILRLILEIGNFLNARGSCGNAAGFKLNSLWKILDLKANKKGLTLLHFIALQGEQYVNGILEELKTVPSAAKLSIEGIRSDANGVSEHLYSMIEELETKPKDSFFSSAELFFKKSRIKIELVERKVKNLNELVGLLALYFCEDEKTFKLEESLKILAAFLARLRDAMKDNEQRKDREQRNEQKAAFRSDDTNRSRSAEPDLLQVLVRKKRPRERSRESGERVSDESQVESEIPSESWDLKQLQNGKVEMNLQTNKISSMVSLRRHSRRQSDALLIRNSRNLDEFLSAAEKLENHVLFSNDSKKSSNSSLNSKEEIVNSGHENRPRENKIPRILISNNNSENEVTNVQSASVIENKNETPEGIFEKKLSNDFSDVNNDVNKVSKVKLAQVTTNVRKLELKKPQKEARQQPTTSANLPKIGINTRKTPLLNKFRSNQANNENQSFSKNVLKVTKLVTPLTKKRTEPIKDDTRKNVPSGRKSAIHSNNSRLASLKLVNNIPLKGQMKTGPNTSESMTGIISSSTNKIPIKGAPGTTKTPLNSSLVSSQYRQNLSNRSTPNPLLNKSKQSNPNETKVPSEVIKKDARKVSSQLEFIRGKLNTPTRSSDVNRKPLSSPNTGVGRHFPARNSRVSPVSGQQSNPPSVVNKLPIANRQGMLNTKASPGTASRKISRPSLNATPPPSTEKHRAPMKRTDSCSTASRPALIKTGSLSKPGLR